MISPSLTIGANTADRVPTTTRASPRRILCHCSALSSGVNCECSSATSLPNAATICPAIAGVNPISGTSSSALFPASSARCIAAK